MTSLNSNLRIIAILEIDRKEHCNTFFEQRHLKASMPLRVELNFHESYCLKC